MELPFTTDQFLGVFRDYNLAIWPAQILAYVLGGVAVGLSFWQSSIGDRINTLILAAMWFWMGGMYHIGFFSEINPAAYGFGAAFILQGLLFLVAATGRLDLRFEVRSDAYGVAGALLILYAMGIYPLIGVALGHGYPNAPMFGVAPCPATIFTFGLLLWTRPGVSRWLLVIPSLWALVGTMAALTLGIREDLGLLVAGVVGVGMIVRRSSVPNDQGAKLVG